MTAIIVLVMCLIDIGLEVAAVVAGSAMLAGAAWYVLRFALPMLGAYFFSGCRCGDGPFFLTTGGFLGAVGALIGAGMGLMFQNTVLAAMRGADPLAVMVLSFTPYVVLTVLGAFAASYRWHSHNLEILWGDDYGAETGRTALEKLRARMGPPSTKR